MNKDRSEKTTGTPVAPHISYTLLSALINLSALNL